MSNIAENTVVIDGQVYHKGDTIPDLGSLECVSANGDQRDYEGLLSDLSKLPHYVDSGSTAMLYDGNGNTEVYSFNKKQDTWYKL